VEEYSALYESLREKTAALADLRLRERQLLEKKEFYEFQIREIDAVGPHAGEELELERELKILENAERLYSSTGRIYEMLYEGDRSVHDQLVVARNQLQGLTDIDDRFKEAAAECASAEAVVSELAKFIQGYNARVEFNPERLDELRDRLGKMALLKKKYGGSLDAVLEHRERIGQEVALAANFDEVIAQWQSEVESVRNASGAIAQRLSGKRHDAARKIEKGIVAELAKLGIEHGRFGVSISQREIGSDDDAPLFTKAGRKCIALAPRGYDNVEFMISTNLGEEPKPLAKVASGGEVSRIMLALKSILAKSDSLPVLIFDEIDVGVSGKIAQAVGLSLKSLSAFHQVIAITHLPQIAGLADIHFAVSKSEKSGRATTSIHKLNLEEQVQEVAKLMSGAEVTQVGMAGARELMGLK
jgi:DNA repair protein RecN (Recombination protein N)